MREISEVLLAGSTVLVAAHRGIPPLVAYPLAAVAGAFLFGKRFFDMWEHSRLRRGMPKGSLRQLLLFIIGGVAASVVLGLLWPVINHYR